MRERERERIDVFICIYIYIYICWARLGKVHIGVDRHTAAKYGFDDKVFYDEVDDKAQMTRLNHGTSSICLRKCMQSRLMLSPEFLVVWVLTGFCQMTRSAGKSA